MRASPSRNWTDPCRAPTGLVSNRLSQPSCMNIARVQNVRSAPHTAFAVVSDHASCLAERATQLAHGNRFQNSAQVILEGICLC